MFVSAALSVVSGIVGAVGAMQQANAQAAAEEYNAKINQRNARASLQQGEADQEDKQRQNMRDLSSVRAAYGASGVQLAGSPLDVIYDSAAEQALDVKKIDYASKLRAQGYSEQAVLNKMGASAAKKSGAISAVANILGGLNSAAKTVASGAQAGQSLMAA